VLVVTLFIPVRLFFLLALLKMYQKGKKEQDKIKSMNTVILYEIFKICVDENELNEMKGYLIQNKKPIDKKLS